ncbi:MAG: phosphohistidine phosphatase SixA, partial [Isosphaeraceae bacterium]|nr:phosphohistidine phosphatase SixA [Isosphaeraceae bacterium]
MIRLYLLRHGIAVPPGTPGLADDDRPLTPKGEKRVRLVAEGLRRLRLKLDRIATSPLPRARRTAEIVAEALGIPYLLEDVDALRAQNDAATIREWLNTRNEQRLMLVGHNPALMELPGLLITGESVVPLCELRKAGIVALAGPPEGGLRIDWMARP